MAEQKIQAIIFDIGRVLVRMNISGAVQGLARGVSLTPEEIWTAIQKDPRWPDWQEGRISPHDWYLHLSRRFASSLTFEQFTEAWNATLDPHPIQDNSLFETLRETFHLGLLSNTDPIHVTHLESNFDFFRFFPKSARTYSCAVGASKPSPLIFRDALKSLHVKAENAAFVDDVEAYVSAARNLGIHGIHYRSPEQLKADLGAIGAKLSF